MGTSDKSSQLIVLILRQEERLEEVLALWEEAGASGATVLDCIGRTQLREALHLDDVPMFPSLADLTRMESVGEKLIFTVVSNEELAQRIVNVSRQLLENSSKGKGLLFTVPVGSVFGLGQTPTP
jgi:nitrogen regulatory protein PII